MSKDFNNHIESAPSSGGSVLIPPFVRPITRRVVSDRDHPRSTQSLPTSGTITPNLWNTVRQRIRVTSALKNQADFSKRHSRAFEHEPRFDDEGITSDTLRGDIDHLLPPGQYSEQWQSLAHLFDAVHQPEPAGHSRARSRHSRKSKRLSYAPSRATASPSPARNSQDHFFAQRPRFSQQADPYLQTAQDQNPDDSLASFAGPSSFKGSSSFKLRSRTSNTSTQIIPQDAHIAATALITPLLTTPGEPASSSMDDTFAQRVSISEEPASMLVNDPDQTPLGEDPLLYSTQEHLLESDSDDSDTESETTDDEYQSATRDNTPRKLNITSPRPGVSHHNGNERLDRANQATSHASVGVVASLPTIGHYLSNLASRSNFTLLHRSIFKCALAYLVASLFTYSPALSRWLSSFLPNNDPDDDVPFSNLHMIATVAVYFHPARTLGAMVEADVFALGAFIYAITLGFCSMAVAVFLHETNRVLISDIISVLVFLGLGMAFVGYAKIKVAKPQFNTACSLISIIVFTVVVKEGSMHLGHFSTEKTFQVTLVVLAGSLISNLVCFYVWPQSATSNLQSDIVRNLRGFSTLLRVLTKTFLLEDPSNFHFKSDRIKRAIDDHHDSFTSLKKNLEEAKLESLFDLRMRGMSEKYVLATDSLNRLAQHLTGLRSSCGLQHQIMVTRRQVQKAAQEEALPGPSAQSDEAAMRVNGNGSSTRPCPASTRLAELFENESEFCDSAGSSVHGRTEATAFEDFIASVGPHMRSLVFSCCRTLRSLRSTFLAGDPKSAQRKTPLHETSAFDAINGGTGTWHAFGGTFNGTYIPGTSFDGLQADISNALRRFQHEQTVAIKRIYTMEPKKLAHVDVAETSDGQEGGVGVQNLLQKGNGDEDIFLIFFFVFNLEEFAKELEVLVEALEEIRQAEERIALARQTSRWMRVRLFMSTFGVMMSEYGSMLGWRWGKGKKKKLNSKHKRATAAAKKMATPLDFPSNRRHAIKTDQTPEAMTLHERLQRLVWSVGEFFRQPDTKFAIKAGLGSALLASPAFFPSTRAIFTKFQGQWALVSFMVVLSPTVGQSNHMSLHRILGTILGACAAVGVYKLFPDNNVMLPVFGLLFSIPCFRYIVGKPQLASSGRFVLLTYNLTALYSYNLRKTNVEVEQIAYQRTVSVIVGVVWATVLNQLVWPFEARRQLALGVSDVLFKLAWLYQRLVLSYSRDPSELDSGRGDGAEDGDDDSFADDGSDGDEQINQIDDEEAALLGKFGSRHHDELQAIELDLQVSLIKLEGLLAQTKHEPRLKGPFPVATYRSMLSCCQNILDKLHSMRCVTTRQDWYRHVRRDFVMPVNSERREMVGNILLFFYTLGSAFHLKSPVPPYFPAAGQCRARLLDRIRELPVVKRRAVRGSSAYLLFYSYALAMKDVIDQLEGLGRLTQQNFGVWGGSAQDFERHFVVRAESVRSTPLGSKKPSRSNLGE
ncbi:related to BRE4 - protein involved in endocytosis [Melanopsichium pennsylvanicum]|uniref:Related to BRE4 - protein involved in endocytosis n=2 Tax=Melanopsichium pennsylvanicum TaxID=63383 RepID=A0AAJ4XJK7_9BASI|nr:related to BRE4-protein involved in endocytosis [Melanopsichium pennsylvanicum 4]SNX83328.1 related to BRE4 - protein involved in endocytosis [Melanopsichium pennsylvanicum]